MALVPYGKHHFRENRSYQIVISLVPTTKKQHNNNNNNNKVSRRQPIRGHLMKLSQFNQPVYCALCNEFIW